MKLKMKQKFESRESKFLRGVWQNVCVATGSKKCASIIVVCHLIQDSLSLIEFLNELFSVEVIIPKPKSINASVRMHVAKMGIAVADIHRMDVSNYSPAIQDIVQNRKNQHLLILDMGGYFSSCIDNIHNEIGSDFLGVVEDTENGLKRYRNRANLPVPVFSVADSTLKRPENLLVGASTVDPAYLRKSVGLVAFV